MKMSGQSVISSFAKPPTDLQYVVDNEIKEWHFHIYFHQNNTQEHSEALQLRDAVLRLRRDGAFIAVPLFRVNTGPIGPHPVGSYEVWCPAETFASVFSYLSMYRGNLSVLIHPLTRDQKRDHESRAAWLGQPYPLDTSKLPVRSEDIPSQYHSLQLGYAAQPSLTLDQRRKLGENVEHILTKEKEAAKAPPRD
ncbi:DOPA-like domain-containing protein, partial [Crepidotus variabilis]